MGIILQADQRTITQDAKYSFLSTNYASAVSSVTVLNATDSAFAANAFVMFGLFGSEETEIKQISSVNSTTGEIVLTSTTKFAHTESTRVTVLPFNQVNFYWYSTSTFSIGTATDLSGKIDLQASDWFTTYTDESQSTGYGYFLFYNSSTALYSQASNPIPYIGYDRDTVEDVLSDFFSLLSNKELRLVTRRDALSWLNEGNGIIRNKLNLTNVEYTAAALQTISIVSGTQEYSLPSDFDHLISLNSGLNTTTPGSGGNYLKRDIEYISLREAYGYTGSSTRYYIRGSYIGIVPTPTASDTYHYQYLAKAARLSLNSDQIVLPDSGAYAVKDFMMYRAYMKFNNPLATTYYKTFKDNLDQIIISSVKRDASLSSFGITREANV